MMQAHQEVNLMILVESRAASGFLDKSRKKRGSCYFTCLQIKKFRHNFVENYALVKKSKGFNLSLLQPFEYRA